MLPQPASVIRDAIQVYEARASAGSAWTAAASSGALPLATDAQHAATPPEVSSMRDAWLIVLLLTCASLLGCGVHIPLPTLSVHALSQLTRSRQATETRRARDFLVLVQLTFETPAAHARRPRTTLERELLSAGLEPLPGTCEEAALCEWASLAEEATLSALGVAP
jgi:hypothetical protein